MTDMTDEAVKSLLEGATPGPWRADGEPWNRVVWSSAENRVCFMAHTNGLDDARDIATSDLVAAAPDLARQLLATMTALAEAQAAQAVAVERAAEMAAEIHSSLAAAIRSIADPTGVKLLAEMRAEIERLKVLVSSSEAERYRSCGELVARLAEAQKREAGYQEALIWCSGSDDFQADGKARAGWLKLCAPLIDRTAAAALRAGKGETP